MNKTTDKQIEALKLALEALEIGHEYAVETAEHFHIEMAGYKQHRHDAMDAEVKQIADAITTIRKALAEQPAQQQEPYGWKVYGVNSLFMGEFAEADAKAEAKRIGGTCIAFPLYTAPQPAQQEPVAYIRKDQLQKAAQSPMLCEVTPEPRQDRIGIYTSPPASKPLTDEQEYEAIGTAGNDLLALAKRWADNEVHVYQFDNEARKIIEAVLRRASAKLREKNTGETK